MFGKKIIFISAFILLLFSCKKEDVSYDKRAVGVSANDFLSADNYTTLDIQIQYMPGFAPSDSATNALVIFLNTYLNKPDGIKVIKEEIASSSFNILALSDVADVESRYRTAFTRRKTISVHILITNGFYNLPETLATSYRNTSFSIFGQALHNNSGGPGQISRNKLLLTLLEHEFGHLLGLVNQGSPLQVDHHDPNNPSHCDNDDCLMYYNVETSTNNNLNTVRKLDLNCRFDLKANGAK